jgi:hypothetical protein
VVGMLVLGEGGAGEGGDGEEGESGRAFHAGKSSGEADW